MRRISALLAIAVVLAFAAANAPGLDGTPTRLVKQAKALGISKAGSKYRFHEEERIGDQTLRLTVDVPTAWSDIADSHFINPDTEEPYGAGLRATTDADKFHNSFDVPAARINVAGLTPDELDAFDPSQVISDNAPEGCRDGRVRAYDNGTWVGKYQTFTQCGSKDAAVVVVAGVDRGSEILVFGVALTKADLAAIDRVLSSATVEKTSV